jgi:hypothetical protein
MTKALSDIVGSSLIYLLLLVLTMSMIGEPWYQGRSDMGVQRCETVCLSSSGFWLTPSQVSEIPTTGPWIRAFLPNGTIALNTGDNGLGRLDRIVRIAHDLGIYVLFSLTNNW